MAPMPPLMPEPDFYPVDEDLSPGAPVLASE
jgi:hypothetical protein